MKEKLKKGHLRTLNLTHKNKDLYEILGIDKEATFEEIKRVFLQLARKYHPDVNPEDPESRKRFKPIYNAYCILNDEKKRERYDKFLQGAFDYEKYLPKKLLRQETEFPYKELRWSEFVWIFGFTLFILITTISITLVFEHGFLLIIWIVAAIITMLLAVFAISTLIFGEGVF